MSIVGETRTIVGIAHPLDSLSRENASRAVSSLKGEPAAAESFRLMAIGLHEPAKDFTGTRRSLRARAERCITDLHLVVCFGPWSISWFGDNAAGRRVMRARSRARWSLKEEQPASNTGEVVHR